jgi:diguanylate cyclase (GGDEF)-like protein/PAS domain S-box-containing protein
MRDRFQREFRLDYQEIVAHMTEGFAYQQLIFQGDRPVDALFLEVNRAFAEIIGQTRERIVGRRGAELLPALGIDAAGWSELYVRVAVEGEPLRLEAYSTAFGRWFQISAFSYERDCVALIFQDISALKENQLKLEEISHEYETIFNGTQDAITLYDVGPDGELRYRRLNRSHESATGLTTAQVSGKTPQELLGEQMRQLEAQGRLCIERKAPVVYQEELSLPTGVRSWSTALSPVIRGGRVVQVIAARRDITELQRTIRALQESEQRYSSLFENSHSVMLLIRPGDGRIVDANPAACRYYGYSREALQNMNISAINALSAGQVQEEMAAAGRLERRQFHFRHRLAGGTVREVEVFSGPVRIGGEPYLFSIVHDVTERKRAEAALYEEKERLKVTLHSIGDAVITTDMLGKVTLLNEVAERLTGWRLEEALGRPLNQVFRIINENTRLPCENPVKKVLETGLTVELANHTALIGRDGAERSIADSGAPIKNADGQVFGVVLVFRDITEQKQREEEIKFLSFHDKLTGLYNRAFFEEAIVNFDHRELLPLSLIIGDVNGLKLSNDIFGHSAGDRLLVRIAAVIRETCRPEDFIARWGGDEFAVILPRTSRQQAMEICGRIKERCDREPSEPIQPSIALGTSTKVDMAQNIHLLLKQAEDRMYRNKLLEGKSVRNSLIASLEKTLFERSFETEEHAQRMLNIAQKFGRAAGLSSSEQDELNLLAILHDIGKIGIHDSILSKPDRLTAEEWREMEKHPEIGYRTPSPRRSWRTSPN